MLYIIFIFQIIKREIKYDRAKDKLTKTTSQKLHKTEKIRVAT
jgi:hypothetical protein